MVKTLYFCESAEYYTSVMSVSVFLCKTNKQFFLIFNKLRSKPCLIE